ncbi:MAG: cytochrome P450 [Jatrophihabitantaceae bacterium]
MTGPATLATPVPRRFPGPPLRATPKLLRLLVADRLGMMNLAAARYGDAVRLRVGPKTLYVFNEPSSIKHVLVDNAANYHKGIGLAQARRALGDGLLTSDGEQWAAQRKVMQPAFQAKRIAEQAELVAAEAADWVARLSLRAGSGAVDITAEMTNLTLGVLGRTLLDADLDGYAGIGHSFEAVQDQAMFEMVSLGLVPLWLPLPKQLRFRRAQRRLGEVVDALVADRLRRGELVGDDALARLITSLRAETGEVRRQRGRDELTTLLLAGHETTASTLSWAFHLLDEHPAVARRMRAEATAVLGTRAPNYDDLSRLPYITMVVEEVMRLYPPVWILPRSAQADDEINGYPVPAGSDVIVSPYIMHRHPRYWPDPERFVPERFDRTRSSDRPRYAYLPFGAGRRVCIGSNLAMMEAVFVLSTVVRQLELRKLPGRPVIAEPMLSLRIRGGLPMTVHRI